MAKATDFAIIVEAVEATVNFKHGDWGMVNPAVLVTAVILEYETYIRLAREPDAAPPFCDHVFVKQLDPGCDMGCDDAPMSAYTHHISVCSKCGMHENSYPPQSPFENLF